MSARAHDWLTELRAALRDGAADGVMAFPLPRARERVLCAVEAQSRREAWDCDLSWLRYLRRLRQGWQGRQAKKWRKTPAAIIAESDRGG